MKNAVILHGTDATAKSNWFPWLKEELEIIGYEVWAPDLPNSGAPNEDTYTKFFAQANFPFNEDTILIGHSSGAVALLKLLPKIGASVRATFLVSAFDDDLGWPNLKGLFVKPFNFDKIRQNGGKIFFFHSDDDPYIPLMQADRIARQCAGTLIPLPGQGHFSTENDPSFREFPKLLGKIKESTRE